jgi:hypothetical protein
VSHERTLPSNSTSQQIEAVRLPVQPVQSHPKPQVSAPAVIEPVPAGSLAAPSALKSNVTAPPKSLKPVPEHVEAVRPLIQPVQAPPKPQEAFASPAVKPVPASSVTVASAPVAAPRKLSLVSKPLEPEQVHAVRPPVQPVQIHLEPQVSAPPMIKSALVGSTAVLSAPRIDVVTSNKLTLTSKPAPEPVEAVRAAQVQPVQIHKVSASPVIEPVPVSNVTVPSAPVATSRKLSLSSKPAPEQVHAVRPPVQSVLAHPELSVSAPPVIKPALVGSTAVPSAPKLDVVHSNKLTLPPKPVPEQVEAVRSHVQPVQIYLVSQVSAPPVIKPDLDSSATIPNPPVATSRKLLLSSKPEPQQVQAARPPVQPAQIHPGPQVSTSPVVKPALASSATVPSAPKSDVPAPNQPTLASGSAPELIEAVRSPAQPAQVHGPQVSASPAIKPVLASSVSAAVPSAPRSDVPAPPKPTFTSRPAPEQIEAVRPPAQPAQAHTQPLVSASPVVKPASSRSAAAPSAPEQARPRVEPVLSPNPPARIPEAFTPPVTASKAPAPDKVSAVQESARPRVEMARRPVQLSPAPQSLTSSTGSWPAPAGGTSPPSKVIPAPERTRSQAYEAVRIPSQHTHLMSAAGNPATTSSSTNSQVASVPRPAQVVRPTPGSSAVPVRHGPVPASSVPSPNVTRLPPGYARPQVGAGRTSTMVSRAPPASRVPPIGITPSGSASGPDMKEVSRHRIKSHPRKMVTPAGQRRSVIAPSMMVTQPTAPPPELPKSPPVQQPTTHSPTQNSSSVPLQGTSSRRSTVSSPPEAQDKPKVRTAAAPAPAVPTAASAAPTPPGTALSTRVGDTTSVPAPTILERGPRISNTDGVTGRSRQSTIVPEQAAPRHAGRSSVLSPMHPEQSATSSSPSRSSSTPTARQDRASVVLPDSSPQKRANHVSIPGGWDSVETTTVTTPALASRATNAAAPVGNATIISTSNVSPISKAKDSIREPRPLTPLPEPIVLHVTARVPAQPVTLPKKQQTEQVTSPLPKSDPVAKTRHGETTRSSSYRSRAETSTVVSGAEKPQGEAKPYYSTAPVYPRQQADPVLRGSTQRITSRIRTKDLINRHKPQAANDARPPSMAQSTRTPTSSKSPTTLTSQCSPTTPDPNHVDSGIGIWDYSPLEARIGRQRGSSLSGNGDRKGPADGAAASMHPTRLPTVLEKKGSRRSLAHQESRMSISKSSKHPFSIPSPLSSPPEPEPASSPNTTESASTPPARGGAFLTRKPQGSFQTSYQETSTPPRSSTPSSMTHASTAATSTQATLVTPASSFPNLSSLGSKAEPKSWFRRNVLDPFKSRLGLASA